MATFLRQVSVPTLPAGRAPYILSRMQSFIQSLLQHQRSRTPWSTASVELQGNCYLAQVGATHHKIKLSLPKSIGLALKTFIKKLSRSSHFQEKVTDDKGSYLLRSNTNRLEISDIPSSLSDPKSLLLPEQKEKIKDMLDSRSGIMLLSAPTAGATLAALDGVGHVIKEIDKKQKVSVLLLNEDTAVQTLNNTTAKGSSFVLILAPMNFNTELWQGIEQAALAGSMMVLGVPSNTPTSVLSHQKSIEPMLHEPLLAGLVTIVPFVGGCKACSKAVDLHPDVPAYLSHYDNASNLKGLKGAHAPGCNHCSFTGAGDPLPTVSLFAVDELTDDVDKLHQNAIVTDLLYRARSTPVPLRHATKMWRSRPR